MSHIHINSQEAIGKKLQTMAAQRSLQLTTQHVRGLRSDILGSIAEHYARSNEPLCITSLCSLEPQPVFEHVFEPIYSFYT